MQYQIDEPNLVPQPARWFQLLRLPNLAMMAVLQFLVYTYILEAWANVVKIHLHLDANHLAILSASTAIIAGAGYVVNDYYDQKIDAINHPDDCVIGKYISEKQAMWGYLILNLIGLGLVAFLAHYSVWIPVIHGGAALTLWLYARYLKRVPLLGNIVVALLCMAAVVEVFIMDYLFNPQPMTETDFYTPFYQTIAWEYIVFVGVATLLREIAKDIEDLDGDLIGGRKTLAITLGWVRTKYLLAAMCWAFALGLAWLSWLNWTRAAHFSAIYLAWGLALPMIGIGIQCWRGGEPRYFGRISLFLKIYFVLGMLWLFLFEI